jgi:hypothetical protein
MIEDLIQRGCTCYDIKTGRKIDSISETYFTDEPRKIEWGGPDEDYEYRKMKYRLTKVEFPVCDVITTYEKAYGDAGSRAFVERLSGKKEVWSPDGFPVYDKPWESKSAAPQHQENRAAELEELLAQARQEIARLTEEIVFLKTTGNGAQATVSNCASCRAESSHSDEWTQDVECAVALACDLSGKGEKGSTLYHNGKWKERRGHTRKRAFEAFRRALPDHLKENDPKKK